MHIFLLYPKITAMDKCGCHRAHNCLEELRSDHQKILESFDGLEKSISKNPLVYEEIGEFLEFTKNFSEPHHKKEEKVLFPALEKKGIPNEGGPIGMMLFEHETKRSHIKKIDEGFKEKNGEKILLNAKAAISLMREHIEKENNILYPMAEEAFTPEELDSLGEECAKL